jgi:hypothetical protein
VIDLGNSLAVGLFLSSVRPWAVKVGSVQPPLAFDPPLGIQII